MAVIAVCCYLFSLFINKLISAISLFSSLLCPIFIIICPAVLSYKLKEKLKLGRAQINFIIAQTVLFVGVLSVSIAMNLIDFFNDESVVG